MRHTARNIAIAIIAIVVAIAGLYIYTNFDPSASRFFPQCVFLKFTGYKCPGCGSQRAVHALLHGDIAQAWHFNAALLVSIPILAVYTAAAVLRNRRPQLYAKVNHPWAIYAIGAAIIFWWIARNIFNW